MKIMFLVPYPAEGPSNRYRVEQFLSYLSGAGVDYCVRPFWKSSVYSILYKKGYVLKKLYYFIVGSISRIADLTRIIGYDAVFVHRESYPIGGAFFETLIKLMGKPIIYDFDDALFLPSCSGTNSFMGYFKNPTKISEIIKLSSAVIAGNNYLADFAGKFSKNVFVIPTSIDTAKYRVVSKKNNERIVIGWMGSVTTVEFMNCLDEVIRKLSLAHDSIYFKIVGGDFRLKGVDRVVSKQWEKEEEMNDLNSFDIGIMPMPDNLWTRGKCGFKAILYMSMGIPCVCSPVGVNKEIINDGVNGFLADTDGEWFDKLSLLIKDPALRKKIGEAGRKRVEEKYSVEASQEKFLEVILQTIRKTKRGN